MNLLHRPRRLLMTLACGVAAAGCAFTTLAQTNSPAAILQEMKSFREFGSVLYIAAHPDDENTLLIGYLARGRDYRTAYLSLTRGDGGQNVLGPQFDEKLGVARTQELLAARRLDGGRQFFSRAMDFGFSKDYKETLSIWDRQQVLSDVVRVIREFRPDVLINRFSTTPGGTHGHHTASAILGLEAFKLAGDPKAFPEQNLPPWQPKHIFLNGRGGEGIQMEISGTDSVTGLSFTELAAQSRAMHKTQGFDNFRFGRGGGTQTESFQLLAGDPATNDIMDGVDTTWNRVPGGADMAKLADSIVANFNPQDPSASVPDLLKLRSLVAALPNKDSVVEEKSKQLDHILQSCLGLELETTIPNSEVVPGETMKLHHSVVVHSSVPVRWVAVRYPSIGQDASPNANLQQGTAGSYDANETLPASTPLTQPYWLREEHPPGMFVVDDPKLIGRPENPPTFPIEWILEVGGQTLDLPDEPVQVLTNPAGREIRRKLDAIPPVSLKFDAEVALFTPGKKSHPVEVEITASRANLSGTLQLDMPDGWSASPVTQPFALDAVGDKKTLSFTITAPDHAASAKVVADAEIGGVHFRNEREEISYPHIPRQLLQPVAKLKVLSLDLATRGHTLGYLPGAGDLVAECLTQMGYDVKTLDDSDLTTNNLQNFDAVVIGVRAFNVRANFASHIPDLFAYVQSGGTVVAQYNRLDPKATPLAPYDLHLSNDRVTDETAKMTFLAPDHPVLNTPNKITDADFDGWVQERGIYFPNQWDDHFTPIFACNDPGESPLKGSLLVAQYGKGYYVYTGLDFFRQLPAGVPGSYRLFANLISLGK
jgi:LmbE family N-acetylglucosaminyl deacetylase